MKIKKQRHKKDLQCDDISLKYLWKCGSCPNKTFETVAKLFSHKKLLHSKPKQPKTKAVIAEPGKLICIKLEDTGNDCDSADSDEIPLAQIRLRPSRENVRVVNDLRHSGNLVETNLENIENVSETSNSAPNYEVESGYRGDSLYSSDDESQDSSELPKHDVIEVKHTCKICKLNFESRKSLSKHKSIHICSETGMYKCNICGKQCPKYDNFTRHLTIHEQNRAKTFSCEHCTSSFYNMADLKRHSVLHMSVKPFMCDQCDEGFTRQDALLIHTAKHTGIPCDKFTCNVCGRVLNSPSALAMHSKNHTTKTVFCPETDCDFSCYLLSQLRQHLRKHSGEKPFQCSVCGRCFARSNDMKNHVLNVHERVRPFKCPYCPKEFTLQSGLRTHRLIHLDVRPYLCSECGKSFNHASSLRKHMIVLHRDVCNKDRGNKPVRMKQEFKKLDGPKMKEEVTYVNVGVQSVLSIPLQIPQITVSLDQGLTQAFIIPAVTQITHSDS